MEKLRTLLVEMAAFSESECAQLEERMRERTVKTGERLMSAGQVARALFFIESGLLRTYHLEEGKEVTTYFACDGQAIATYASFITQTPSMEFLEAGEDSRIHALSHDSLMELYRISPSFERLGRILAERNYLCILDRTLAMQTKTAKERYLKFLADHDPKIINGVPQRQIASFLGIAPESLSRVRRELSRS